MKILCGWGYLPVLLSYAIELWWFLLTTWLVNSGSTLSTSLCYAYIFASLVDSPAEQEAGDMWSAEGKWLGPISNESASDIIDSDTNLYQLF